MLYPSESEGSRMKVVHPLKGMIALAAAVPVLIISGLPAEASTASVGVVNEAPAANQSQAVVAPANVVPEVKIIHSKSGPIIFSTVNIDTTWSAPRPQTCTTSLESAIIANRSGQTQELVYNEMPLEKLPTATSAGLCFFGSGVFTFRFKVVGSSETLRVNVS
jgi:hypothetical protein